MGKLRKKTLQELMQERATGTGNQSAYTTEPRKVSENQSIKSQVDSLYKRNESKSFSEKVTQKYNQIMNDIGKIGSNFFTSTSSNIKNSLYYIESASNKNFENYRRMNQTQARLKEEQEERKRLTQNTGKKNQIVPPSDIREFEVYKGEDLLLRKPKETESPIQKALRESIQKDEEKIQKNIESTETKVGRKLAELAPSINQSITGMGLSAVNPALGISFFQTSAGGNYTREAQAKGMNQEQAFTYGTIMGALESATESVGNKLTTNVGKAFFKDGAKEGLKAFGLDIAENFLEEAVMEPLSEYVTQLTGGQANWENIGQRMWESGINGAISSVLMGGASAGIGKAVQLVNKMQNGEQVTQKEIADTLKEINKSEEVEIEKLLFDSFKFTADDLMRNTDAQNRINQKLDTYATDISKNEFASIKPTPTMENKAISEQGQQTTLPQGKMTQNQTSQQIEEIQKNIQNQVKINDSDRKNIQELTKYNIEERKDASKIEMVKPKDIMKNISSIGNRDSSIVNTLVDDIKESGIKKPIYISKETGKIVDGTHRLIVANELGLDEVPVKYINSSNDIENDSDDWYNILKERRDANARERTGIVGTNEGNGNERIDNNRSNEIVDRVSDSTRNDRLYQGIQKNDKRPSTETVYGTDSTMGRGIDENSKKSSFLLPEKNVLQENATENLSKVTTEEFQRYKRKIIEGKQKEINNLIQIKNQTLTEIQSKIDIKEAQLNNLKKPNSITAQKIKAQIEALKERYNRTENEYLQRIDRRNQRVTRALIEVETKRALKRTRKQVQKALLEQAKIEEVNLDDAKNISTLNMNRTDPIRLQEKVFGKEVGDKINEMFFNKVKHNTAEKTRFLNRERDSIKKWDIKPRSKESEILQKYTEKSFVNAEGKEIEYTDSDLIKDIQDEKTRNKIIKASQELRAKYDNYIDTANDILVDLGYSPIPKRKDYVRHFTELNDIFSKYGVPGKLNDSLPTDINGLTEGFRPGKNFFANAQKRLGNKTTYDAITGIDGYLEGISNLIYHTEDIQRLRAFDKFIRDTYGQNGLENFDKLSDTEKNKRIELISNNHLSEYAKWLTEYTNNLAGKNSVFDRSVEGFLGRKVYSALNAIKKQTGSNMTGFNLGSALTNFVSVAQGASKTKKIALFKGLVSSIQNIAVKDDFIERSDFLTNRFGSDSISKKAWDKASNAGQVFMSATDYLSSNIVVRSKYYEQIAKGKTEEEAMKIADDFGARILGDRSQGAVANIFNSKMLGIVTQFQLEVNNQFDTFIHDTKLDYQETTQKEGALKASMGAVWTLGQLAVYQHIFNELFEKINGNRPAFDVIEIVKTALGIDDEEDEEDDIKGNLQEAVVMLVESVPFINLFSENARIPITSAVPNILSVATGESTLKKEASKLLYLLPPTGGGQLKKTAEGIKTVVEGGSYFINSKGEKELRFPVENVGAKDYLKAGVFGKYALPLAKEYVDKDYKRLSAKATELYDNSTIEFRKLNEFLDYSKQKEIKKKDKISYINNMDLTTDQKWDLYKYDVISNAERKDGTSQLSDAEYILKNNMATKSEYMKLYAEAEKNNVEFPATETLKELKEADLELGTYMKYKTALTIANREKKAKAEEQEKSMLPIKEEDKLSKSLNEDEMIDLIKDYSIGDKKKIYENYIGKDDTTYSNLKILTGDKVNIDDYLDYKTEDFSADRKADGTKKGKAVSGSAKNKLTNFLNNSKFNGVERLYIYGQKQKLNSTQRVQLQNYINKLDITPQEKKDIYLDLSSSNVVEMADGSIRWK